MSEAERARREALAEVARAIDETLAEARRVRDRWIAASSFDDARSLARRDGAALGAWAAELHTLIARMEQLLDDRNRIAAG